MFLFETNVQVIAVVVGFYIVFMQGSYPVTFCMDLEDIGLTGLCNGSGLVVVK
jgi:hypothetical protein